MAERIEELNKDLAELRSLETQATRSKVRDLLSLQIRKVSSEIIELQEKVVNESKSQAPKLVPSGEKRYEIKLTNYAWDQTNKFVKFYVSLNKVHTIPHEQVVCNFTNKSLELKVANLENKDYIFTINNLLKEIDPEKSSWKVKTDTIVINAAKVKTDDWSHVTELEKKVSDAQAQKLKPEDSGDPSQGLMSLMKNMYEKGDDEMKRTIAKAWTESQNKPSPL